MKPTQAHSNLARERVLANKKVNVPSRDQSWTEYAKRRNAALAADRSERAQGGKISEFDAIALADWVNGDA